MMDLFPFTANLQTKICDKSVVRLATDVFQYASDCADREKASTFDILIASLWMTYYSTHSANERTEARKENKSGTKMSEDTDENQVCKEQSQIAGSCLQDHNNVSPALISEVDSDSTLSEWNDRNKIKVYKENTQSLNYTKSSVRLNRELPATCEFEVETNNDDSRIVTMADTFKERNMDVNENGLNVTEANADHQSNNPNEIVGETNTLEQGSKILMDTDEEVDNKDTNQKMYDKCTEEENAAEIEEKVGRVSEQDNSCDTKGSNLSETNELGVKFDVEDKNNGDTVDDEDDVNDHSMFGIQITNVTSGLDAIKDITEVKVKTELPDDLDGLIIEINEDDDSNMSDEEAPKQYGEAEMPAKLFDEKKKSDDANPEMDDPKTNVPLYLSESNIKPVMMMSNLHYSQNTQPGGKVTKLDTKLGPMVSVQTLPGQQRCQDSQMFMLENPSQFPQSIIPRKQVPFLRQPLHFQHYLPLHHPQGNETVQGGINDQMALQTNTQLDTQAIVHPTFTHLSSGFIASLTKEAQSKFTVGNKIDFVVLDSVISQILQLYPFFLEKVNDLCLQLLGQNSYLYSLYKTWKEQNRETDDSPEWSLNDPVPVVGLSPAVPGNFEISMENVADDSFVNSNLHLASGVSNTDVGQYLSPFHSNNILGCTVKRNVCQRTNMNPQTSVNEYNIPGVHPAADDTSMLACDNGHSVSDDGQLKANNVVNVHPVTASTLRKPLFVQKVGRVQCATVTSSGAKKKLPSVVNGSNSCISKLHLESLSKQSRQKGDSSLKSLRKHKRQKRDPSIPPRVVHPNSLKNLKQNRDKKLHELLTAQTDAHILAVRLQQKQKQTKQCVKKEQSACKVKKKLRKFVTDAVEKKLRKVVPTDKKPVNKLARKPAGYRQLAELQRQAGDIKNIGSTERGAKVKAQKKLNVYNEIINKTDVDSPALSK